MVRRTISLDHVTAALADKYKGHYNLSALCAEAIRRVIYGDLYVERALQRKAENRKWVNNRIVF